MHLSLIDYFILGLFFFGATGLAVFCSRKSAAGYRTYFLGAENKWWMLAASGASTHFSVYGTVWNLAILMVLGLKSFYVTLVWWMPNAVFLMAYSGIWIRRCKAMTAVELNRVRFGQDRGAHWARSSFALMIALFSVSSLCLSYIVMHKFAVVFGCSHELAHGIALATVAATSSYVLLGGFKGVIVSEFLQTIVLFSVAFVIACVGYAHYSPASLHAALTHGTGAEAVSADYWKSLLPEPRPRIGMFAESGYREWKDFAGMVLAGSVVGMLGCIGGAGGRYGEQRFLATKNAREAALLAALWQVLCVPRWVMTGGLCFVGFALYKTQIAHDPEAVLPLFLKSGLLQPGLLGLVAAGLSGSFMTNFCSEINACASIVVRDLYQPLFRSHLPDEAPEFVTASYITTATLALLAAGIGYVMVESQRGGGGSALNVIWAWMLGGLLTCLVVPLALRWYWGRMNGWGFSAGCLAGLAPSLLMLARNFVPEGTALRMVRVDTYIYATLAVSATASIVGSLVTPPMDDRVGAEFYARVRPFGFWTAAARRARELGLPLAAALPLPRVAVNIVLGFVATFALYLAPVYFIGHWPKEAAICTAIFVGCALLLTFTWYRALPND